ncbi:GNAT family N-acetyltransferase [Microbacterium paraoxydans]|uniref:GNAT family N-acetyltransferase n=1 Tax=Microbacterium paraoxydans TaxID=199592 RepID=A0ABS5ISD8_9MICO|nr:GNAT family N-acetyltransferase [Microbacterium paraoxydans]
MLTLRPAAAADAEWIAELRAEVLRDDLERLGRFDETRVRRRFLDAFVPEQTSVIVVDGVDVGSVALRPEGGALWLEHFYLATAHQGRGIGTRVLAEVLAEPRLYRLDVLQGSSARRLYERHGFLLDRQDDVDVFLMLDRRTPAIDESADR